MYNIIERSSKLCLKESPGMTGPILTYQLDFIDVDSLFPKMV